MVSRRKNTGMHIIPMERLTRHKVQLHGMHHRQKVQMEEKQRAVAIHVQFYKHTRPCLSRLLNTDVR